MIDLYTWTTPKRRGPPRRSRLGNHYRPAQLLDKPKADFRSGRPSRGLNNPYRVRVMRVTPRRHTVAKRMRADLVEMKETLNRMRHVPVPEQGRWRGR
jgi:hypothetical protein